MNDYSYTQTAVNAISSYKNQYGLIAAYTLRIQSDNPEMPLLNAMAVAHDRTTVAATNHKFNNGPAPVANPIAFLDYVQVVMNKVCGLARQDMKGKRTADFGNGVDFSQDLTDQLGFSVDVDKIAGLVDHDFMTLNNVQCYIAQGMEYLTDIPALRYHCESIKLEDGTWVKDNIADSFDDAVTIINTKAEAYITELAETRLGEAANLDFTGSLQDTPDQTRTTIRLKDGAEAFDKVDKQRKDTTKAVQQQLDTVATNIAKKHNLSPKATKNQLNALVDQMATA